MNTNTLDLPEWAWTICEKYRLHERTDEPIGGVAALLMDAAHGLEHAALAIFKEDAPSSDAIKIVTEASLMINDALRLAGICSNQLSPASVDRREDGSYIRRPVPAD
ncbi:MAG TPA: hypothetical protein VHL98_02330 [Microvirga sp.]|jgi:hypothetical protein|nr:hypothetical protein [Microvirga sp.]